MRTIWNGSINFGLVNIPIGLAVAKQRKDTSFRTKEYLGERIGFRLRSRLMEMCVVINVQGQDHRTQAQH